MKRIAHIAVLAALLGGAGTVHADTLLIDRANQKPAAAIPVRGDSMQQVQSRFGDPAEKLEPRGGQKQQWPTINRWVYPEFTVYFEKQKVIDVVARQATPEEIGPKPAIR